MSSSPVVHLLKSNDPPDEREAALIHQFLDDHRQQLDEMKALPFPSPALDELDHCFQAHLALLSLIRRMSGELLSEIFTYVSHERKVGRCRIASPPWFVGHICRSWRNAALSAPLLWRVITIHEPQTPIIRTIYPLSMIETQIARSGITALEIWINLRFRDSKSVDHHKILLAALLQHSRRWSFCHVRLRGTPAAELESGLYGMYGKIPRLGKFAFASESFKHGQDHSYLSKAPALRKLILTDSNLSLPSPSIPSAPWHQITYYRAAYTVQDQFEVLLTAPKLVECDLGFSGESVLPEYAAGRHAVLPHLRRMTLGQAHESNFLEHVTAGPALKNLTVRSPYDGVPAFLQRSSSGQSLFSLFLDDNHNFTTAQEIINGLKQVPALKTLGLTRGPSDMGKVWTAMTIADDDADSTGNLCPRLISLVCIWKGPHKEIDASFWSMVQSRCDQCQEGTTNLGSLCVVGIKTPQNFVESVEQGMVLLPNGLRTYLIGGKGGEAVLKELAK
ncbi:hypothetical protein FB45DRAFT_1102980 [Roridomyces roridus]|uniref:F-box domain-containing protein n=1 Tax=Roridomyces roridus TaxID=1738132 RepID=A0AAD7BD28_9AGAR|nr:hypothetical protein FB45DRAFT_1102980 [Roridomyces roridus]